MSDFKSYEDYLNNGNSVTPDEGVENNALGQEDMNVPVETVLSSEPVVSGGIFQSVKNGIGGMFQKAKSAVKSAGSAGKAAITGSAKAASESLSDAEKANSMSKSLFKLMLPLFGGFGAFVAALFGLNTNYNAARYDIANCENDSRIDDYLAENGQSQKWAKNLGSNMKSTAKQIYEALRSTSSSTFDTIKWTGSEWEESYVENGGGRTNPGFGFSDEAIAGILANAYAESSLRPSTYEMDYKVPDANAGEDDDTGFRNLDEAAGYDFILGRNHHTNWDAYVNRIFEIYSASGTSIAESAYQWHSATDSPGAVHPEGEVPGLSGLLPGFGLWQWTGQRAYNLANFADIQPDPVDTDMDSHNDCLWTTELQLAFLYYENWPGLPDCNLLDWGQSEASYYYKSGNLEMRKQTGPAEDGADHESSSDVGAVPEGYEGNVDIGAGATANDTSINGQRLVTTGTWKDAVGHDDGPSYKSWSYQLGASGVVSADDFRGDEFEYGEAVFANLEGVSDDECGVQSSAVPDDHSPYNQRDYLNQDEYDEINTTIRWPKVYIKCSDGTNIGLNSDDQIPSDYLSSSWSSGALPDYTTQNDNRARHIYEIDETTYNNRTDSVSREIVFAPLSSNTSVDDKGYWSITAYDANSGSPVEYTNTVPGSSGSGGRVGDDIRVGRNFTDDEARMVKDMYTIEVDWFKDHDDNGAVHYYKCVSLNLRGANHTVSVGSDGFVSSYDNSMGYSASESGHIGKVRDQLSDPQGKYIAADLYLMAGAETAVECAKWFYETWEGGPAGGDEERKHLRMAESFYLLIQTENWMQDDNSAKSILAMVDDNRTDAEWHDVYREYMDTGCKDDVEPASGIAECAVSWAWPQGTTWYDVNLNTMDGGGDCYWKKACTSMYIAVKDTVAPADTSYYSSCDRGVMTAVRASGADDNFVPGSANGQLQYAQSHPEKWQALGPVRSMSALESLEPGDLLLSSGHVMVFVGPDAPHEKWDGNGIGSTLLKECTYAVVHSSRSSKPEPGSRGPRCDNDCKWILTDSKVWYAFRLTDYDASSQCKADYEAMDLSGFTGHAAGLP